MSNDDLDSHLDRGLQLYRKRRYQRAIVAFQKAFNHAQKTNNYFATVYAYLAIGDCFFFLRNYSDALSHFDKARYLAVQKEDKNVIALSSVKLAKALWGEGDKFDQPYYKFDQVNSYLAEAIQIFNELKDRLGLLYAHGVKGELEEFQGNLEAAKIYYQKASELAHLVNRESLREYFRRKSDGDTPFPYIYYFPYPKGPPVASAEAIPKQKNCPKCQNKLDSDAKICPFCEYQYVR